MVNAFVLINLVEGGKNVRDTAESLLAVDGITEVYTIAGEYDFICVIRVKDNVALSRIVTQELVHKDGIRHTKTLFALDAYAKIDLESVYLHK